MSTLTTAAEILSAMAGTYFRCRSYRDVGMLTMRFFPDSKPDRVQQKPFWTVSNRADRFRFEYRDQFHPDAPVVRRMAWACGDDARDWVDWGNGQTGIRSWPCLKEALTVLGGVSSRVSWVVPSLLIPGWVDGKRWRLCELTRINDDRIGDADCYRVSGHFPVTPGHNELCQEEVRATLGEEVVWNPQVGPVVFWVEKERLLLRRFTDSGRIANFRFELTAEYQPEIDVALTDAELAFGVG